MKRPRSRPPLRSNLASFLSMLAVLAAGRSVQAIHVVAIEEYWELSIGEPDPESSSPQVTMVVSPNGDLDSDYFVFTLNHRIDPEYSAGGMQVQHWEGDRIVGQHTPPLAAALNRDNETVSWVQRLELHDDTLTFEVTSGQSESWGSFGTGGELRISVPTSRENLNRYRPAISIEQSGVGYAGNRVRSLVLRKLRWIDSSGNAHELNAPIDVDADIDP